MLILVHKLSHSSYSTDTYPIAFLRSLYDCKCAKPPFLFVYSYIKDAKAERFTDFFFNYVVCKLQLLFAIC